jgi:hypothetical protein
VLRASSSQTSMDVLPVMQIIGVLFVNTKH